MELGSLPPTPQPSPGPEQTRHASHLSERMPKGGGPHGREGKGGQIKVTLLSKKKKKKAQLWIAVFALSGD